MKKKILFIFRDYNDVDHSTPLIYFLKKSKKFKIYTATFKKKYELFPNKNLDFIKNKLGIKLFYIGDELNLLGNFFYSFHYKLKKSNLNLHLFQILINHLSRYALKISYFFLKSNINKDLKKKIISLNPDIVCIDHFLPINFPYSNLVNNIKNIGSKIISIPHGVMVFSNLNKYFKKQRSIKENYFDSVISTNKYHKSFIIKDFNITSKKVFNLGSLRYNKSWLKKIDEINELSTKRYEKTKFDILILPNKTMYGGNIKNIIYLMDRISKIENVRVAIKPHTRNMKVSFLKKYIDLKNFYLKEKIPTSVLINNSDLIIFWGTSVGLEAILKNKNFIYAKLCHSYPTIYDKILNKNVATNKKRLDKLLLENLSRRKKNKPMNTNEFFLKKYIGNGKTIEKYINFFKKDA